ncbi:MAG: 4-hydroxy-tetrahydrodipicolinate reductase [Verrucomicrobia bacterium]|jgi:4-hydroxy-tetrahydrodipicolinate reductase|nr:MAG: 4-hydroxy-tetrahydrodipicolinate reductase [Verrucomicrobiota bacterium]MDH4470049.1 4-hydroxy-tetrahydrodipicolinate reductase [Verrucomicrobiae bacterium]
MTHIIIYGATGKMGKALLECITHNDKLHLVGALGSHDSIDPILHAADVVIDFTTLEATLPLVEKCVTAKKALVIGTTGHSSEVRKQIESASKNIPMIFSPNFSIGVNTLFWLTRKATAILGSHYDAEIIELHHRFKKDAPSGTARHLAEIIAEVRNVDDEKEVRHGRVGIPGERSSNEIGIHALRAGDAIGEHTVLLGTLGERLELTYRASSREAYAQGALRAAEWLCHKEPGYYDMEDVLELK